VLAHCQRHLAGFKAPKRVLLAAALPKNPSGKLLKRELRQQHRGLFA
jgi:fatty-acyl-CoA synthase